MLQAKGYDTHTAATTTQGITLPKPTPLPYGWRLVKQRSVTGEDTYEPVPLTTDDLLNPQEEDQLPQCNEHFQVMVDLVTTLKAHYANQPIGVFGDLIMDWGIAGLPKPAPDIAIIPNLTTNDVVGGTFRVAKHGSRPSLVIEIMSPWYPGDDTDKVTIYERAGVPEYFLIKPGLLEGLPSYQLGGYRLETGKYRPLSPPPNFWATTLTSQLLQLRFETTDQGRQVRITDLQTGQRLLTPTEAEAARQQEQSARLAAEAARQQEQTARLAAEARAEAEAKARVALEARLRELENLLKSGS